MWKFLQAYFVLFFVFCQFSDVSAASQTKFLDQLQKEGKWAEIILQLKSSVSNTNQFTQNDLILAEAFLNLGRRQDALIVLKRKISFVQGKIRSNLFERIHILSSMFLTRQTFQYYRDGLNEMENGESRKAELFFDKALVREFANVLLLKKMALCQMKSRRIDNAIENLKTAKLIDPYDEALSVYLGRAYFLNGDILSSSKEFETINWNEKQENIFSASWYAELLHSQQKISEAIIFLKNDLSLYSLNIPSLLTQAQIYFSDSESGLKEYWKARASLQIALSRFGEFKEKYPEQSSEIEFRMNNLLKSVDEAIYFLENKNS